MIFPQDAVNRAIRLTPKNRLRRIEYAAHFVVHQRSRPSRPKLTAILIKVGGKQLFKAGLRMTFKTDRKADQDAKNQIG